MKHKEDKIKAIIDPIGKVIYGISALCEPLESKHVAYFRNIADKGINY